MKLIAKMNTKLKRKTTFLNGFNYFIVIKKILIVKLETFRNYQFKLFFFFIPFGILKILW